MMNPDQGEADFSKLIWISDAKRDRTLIDSQITKGQNVIVALFPLPLLDDTRKPTSFNSKFVPSLSDDKIYRKIYEGREELPEDIEDEFVPLIAKPTYPEWFQTFAQGHSSFHIMLPGANIELEFTLNEFPQNNIAMKQISSSCRKWFTCPSMVEDMKGYVVFGMYINTHVKCKWAYIAYTRLKQNDLIDGEDKEGPFILLRCLLTMCFKPRPDFLVYSLRTLQCGIWQGHNRISKYHCDIDATLGVTIEALTASQNAFCQKGYLTYQPLVDNLKM